jgi:hypothetical protein
MSTQAISSSSIYQELQSFYQTRQSDVQSLGSALQSGDLSTAQQAYSQLVALGQSGPFGSSEPFYRSDRANDFEAIGQALSSGDLASAQAAFAKLQQTFGQSQSLSKSRSPAYTVKLSNQSTASDTSSSATNSASSASSSESIYQQLQDFRSERQTDLQQLGQALQAGDLTTAQQDYKALVQLGQQGPFSTAGPFRRSDRAQDFQAIGHALQSGDLAGAQKALGKLDATFGKQTQSGGGPNLHVASSGGNGNPDAAHIAEVVINIGGSTSSTPPSANGSELVLNLPAPSAGSQEEVQINFGGSNGSNDQLTVQVGQTQGQNGVAGEQITINFAQGNNQENIVLNLFGAGSSTQQTQGSSLNVQG